MQAVTPRVSVLLTSYNRPAMLAEAIQSVLDQTFTDFELIVLDDNSSDPGVPQLLASLWNEPRIVVVKSDVTAQDRPRRTRYATMINMGLAVARGEYVTYLCDDDLYYPTRLEVMLAVAEQGHDVVYGTQNLIHDGRVTGQRVAARPLTSARCIVDHSSVLHTREAAIKAGGWDDSPEHWAQGDAAFWDRLTAAGYEFWPVGEVTDAHRFHPAAANVTGGPY